MEGMHEGWNGSTPRLLIGGRGRFAVNAGRGVGCEYTPHVPS